MQAALRIARQLMALLNIALMLGSVMASAQAKTAHTGLLLSATSMPCHHALDSGNTTQKSPLDLCRDLCLTQAPDTMIAPSGVTTAPSVVTELLPVNTYVFEPRIVPRPARTQPVPHAPPRAGPRLSSPKLLI